MGQKRSLPRTAAKSRERVGGRYRPPTLVTYPSHPEIVRQGTTLLATGRTPAIPCNGKSPVAAVIGCRCQSRRVNLKGHYVCLQTPSFPRRRPNKGSVDPLRRRPHSNSIDSACELVGIDSWLPTTHHNTLFRLSPTTPPPPTLHKGRSCSLLCATNSMPPI